MTILVFSSEMVPNGDTMTTRSDEEAVTVKEIMGKVSVYLVGDKEQRAVHFSLVILIMSEAERISRRSQSLTEKAAKIKRTFWANFSNSVSLSSSFWWWCCRLCCQRMQTYRSQHCWEPFFQPRPPGMIKFIFIFSFIPCVRAREQNQILISKYILIAKFTMFMLTLMRFWLFKLLLLLKKETCSM